MRASNSYASSLSSIVRVAAVVQIGTGAQETGVHLQSTPDGWQFMVVETEAAGTRIVAGVDEVVTTIVNGLNADWNGQTVLAIERFRPPEEPGH